MRAPSWMIVLRWREVMKFEIGGWIERCFVLAVSRWRD